MPTDAFRQLELFLNGKVYLGHLDRHIEFTERVSQAIVFYFKQKVDNLASDGEKADSQAQRALEREKVMVQERFRVYLNAVKRVIENTDQQGRVLSGDSDYAQNQAILLLESTGLTEKCTLVTHQDEIESEDEDSELFGSVSGQVMVLPSLDEGSDYAGRLLHLSKKENGGGFHHYHQAVLLQYLDELSAAVDDVDVKAQHPVPKLFLGFAAFCFGLVCLLQIAGMLFGLETAVFVLPTVAAMMLAFSLSLITGYVNLNFGLFQGASALTTLGTRFIPDACRMMYANYRFLRGDSYEDVYVSLADLQGVDAARFHQDPDIKALKKRAAFHLGRSIGLLLLGTVFSGAYAVIIAALTFLAVGDLTFLSVAIPHPVTLTMITGVLAGALGIILFGIVMGAFRSVLAPYVTQLSTSGLLNNADKPDSDPSAVEKINRERNEWLLVVASFVGVGGVGLSFGSLFSPVFVQFLPSWLAFPLVGQCLVGLLGFGALGIAAYALYQHIRIYEHSDDGVQGEEKPVGLGGKYLRAATLALMLTGSLAISITSGKALMATFGISPGLAGLLICLSFLAMVPFNIKSAMAYWRRVKLHVPKEIYAHLSTFNTVVGDFLSVNTGPTRAKQALQSGIVLLFALVFVPAFTVAAVLRRVVSPRRQSTLRLSAEIRSLVAMAWGLGKRLAKGKGRWAALRACCKVLFHVPMGVLSLLLVGYWSPNTLWALAYREGQLLLKEKQLGGRALLIRLCWLAFRFVFVMPAVAVANVMLWLYGAFVSHVLGHAKTLNAALNALPAIYYLVRMAKWAAAFVLAGCGYLLSAVSTENDNATLHLGSRFAWLKGACHSLGGADFLPIEPVTYHRLDEDGQVRSDESTDPLLPDGEEDNGLLFLRPGLSALFSPDPSP